MINIDEPTGRFKGKRLLITGPRLLRDIELARDEIERLGFDLVTASVTQRLTEKQLLPLVASIDACICGGDQWTERVFAEASTLKALCKWGTGVDQIDFEAASKHGVTVRNVPDAFSVPVSDTVICFMLCFARRIPWLTSELKAGRWTPLDGTTLAECTLGVIGAGNIGSAVLRKASAFGMKLLVHDTASELPLQLMDDTRCERVPLDDLLRASDFISVNCDLNPTSHHLINQETLRLMKPSAVLINTARGGCVDEPALVDALRSGAIGGAGLDVFAEEPIPVSSPLRELDNVLLSPHLANSSDRAAHRVHRITLTNICEMLRASASGGPFPHPPANGGPH